MSSAADANGDTSDTATEFVAEEFDTTVTEEDEACLVEAIVGTIENLRVHIDDDRLEQLFRADPGTDVLRTKDSDERLQPEPFTQEAVIEPLFTALDYDSLSPEAGGYGEERKRADYSMRFDTDDEQNRLLVEAEPIGKSLDSRKHGIGQVKGWLSRREFESDFGFAADGLRWAFIRYDPDTYTHDIIEQVDLSSVFATLFEYATVGKSSTSALDVLDESERKAVDDLIRTFERENFVSIAGDARPVIRRKQQEITDKFYDDYIRHVFGIIDGEERTERSLRGEGIDAPEGATGDDVRLFATELMNRLLFIKFLEDKDIVHSDLLATLRETHDDGMYTDTLYEAFLEPLFYDVFDTKPSDRTQNVLSIDLFMNIPYLDGGLFRPRNESSWEGTDFDEPDFDVYDSVLKDIIALLERYEFSADGGPTDLDPSILGNVFEKTINHITSDSGDRNKELGAYYTPDEITRFCAERTVRPALLDQFKRVLHEERGWPEAEVEQYETVEELIADIPGSEALTGELLDVVDSFRVVDPACGSGHFLTSTLEEIVQVRQSLYARNESYPPIYRLKKRTVLNNVYGVDIVGPAVEIGKLRLWLSIIAELDEETADELDEDELALPNIAFNVRQGNSLIGYTGFPEQTEEGEFTLERWSEESVRSRYEAIIEEKRKFREAVTREQAAKHQQRAFELLEESRSELHDNVLRDFERAGVDELTEADVADFDPFHWVLEFAEVYAKGGFDVVVGNPPWDVLTPNRENYFSRYDPMFRTRSQQEKDAKQDELLDEPDIANGWEERKQNMQMRADYFNSNISYELQAPEIAGRTVANNQNDLSSLFLERVFALANDDGYVAQVLPGGVYSSSNTKDLRLHLLNETELEAVIGFENHGIFPEIDNRYQFGVVAFKNSGETDVLRGVFQQRDLNVLSEFRDYTVEIPKRVLAEYSPEARIFPSVNQQKEVDALNDVLSHPSVGETIDNKWELNPYSELHSSKDSDLFVESDGISDYPIYQGKNIYQYVHDQTFFDLENVSIWGIDGQSPEQSAKRFVQSKGIGDLKRSIYTALGGQKTNQSQKQFVNELLRDSRGKELNTDDVLPDYTEYRVTIRQVTNNTNERTLISAVIPDEIVCVDTLHTIRPYRLNPNRDDLTETPLHGAYERVFTDEELFVAVGLLNSLPFDFLMRTKVDSHIVMYKLKESQMPRLIEGDEWFEYIWRRAARLNCYGEAFAEMRERLGIEPVTDDAERQQLQAEIDAAVFHAYGLDREETDFILDDFHQVQNPRMMTPDYFERVLHKYDELADNAG